MEEDNRIIVKMEIPNYYLPKQNDDTILIQFESSRIFFEAHDILFIRKLECSSVEEIEKYLVVLTDNTEIDLKSVKQIFISRYDNT